MLATEPAPTNYLFLNGYASCLMRLTLDVGIRHSSRSGDIPRVVQDLTVRPLLETRVWEDVPNVADGADGYSDEILDQCQGLCLVHLIGRKGIHVGHTGVSARCWVGKLQ